MFVDILPVFAGAFALAFAVSALLGFVVVPLLRRLHFGQTIRDIGPAWHKAKQGTPTMGGFLFIAGTLAAFILAALFCLFSTPYSPFSGTPLTQVKLAAGILLALLCGAVGFMDDYIKVVKKQNLGLTGKQKLLFQTLVAAGYALSLYMARGSELNVPFVGLVDFHIWFVPFCAFTIVAMVNATNLTDGLDGLCTGVSMLSIAFFTLAAALAGYFGQTLFGVCVVGALLGFFLWNRHPARVIMGDLGSLFIGGTLCALAFGVGQPFLLLPAGIIYLIETLSVSLQVLYFKATHGKRLFKMSPIHHHLEMSGYSEWGIVGLFSLITLLGCVVAYFLL